MTAPSSKTNFDLQNPTPLELFQIRKAAKAQKNPIPLQSKGSTPEKPVFESLFLRSIHLTGEATCESAFAEGPEIKKMEQLKEKTNESTKDANSYCKIAILVTVVASLAAIVFTITRDLTNLDFSGLLTKRA